jgi:hypothetical protein
MANQVQEQSPGSRAVLERLFTTFPSDPDWFAPSFRSQVSTVQIDQIIAGLVRNLGPYEDVYEEPTGFMVVMQQGLVPTRITLDMEGRITGLLLQTPKPHVTNLEEAISGLQALPGNVSLLVLENDQEMVSLNPDTPLAVGSAFKLAVMAALKEQVIMGKRSWRDVIELKREAKSLPSGVLQAWPDGAPLTLFSLAAEMISISDNTATDALITFLGREMIERFAARNRPFLTTREAFILKDPANEDLLKAYIKADENSRRTVLSELGTRPLPSVEIITNVPTVLEVEWFFTTRELCSLMNRVADLPLMGINAGIADRRDWVSIAFKGGSESGVVNSTCLVETQDGKTYCISATWNEPTLDQTRFLTLYSGILQALKPRKASTSIPQG